MAQITDETIDDSFVFYANKGTDVYFPIKNSQRVKYTSFHASDQYLAFGSSSGNVYLFRQSQYDCSQYLFTILNGNNCGPISAVAFAPNDHHLIAMATTRGHLIVAEIEPEKQLLYKCSWTVTYQCHSFTKHCINILKWDPFYDYRLYLCDESGQTFILHNVKDMKNLMVMPEPSLILKIMGKIFQFDIYVDLLALSSSHKYVLYDVSSGELTQIGKRTIRSDGQYGICFFHKPVMANDSHIYNCIFCSRPKSRLWECDLKGTVRFTHIFKELLINHTPQQIINGTDIDGGCVGTDSAHHHHRGDGDGRADPLPPPPPSPMPTFGKLCVMNIDGLDRNFIVTYNNGLNACLYIINPINACIVSYCILDVSHIHDMYCIDSDIYLLYNLNGDKRLKFAKISFLTAEQCLQLLVENNEYVNGANLLVKHIQYFNATYCKNQHKSHLKIDKIVEKLWSELDTDQREQYHQIQQLITTIGSDESSLVDESQEVFLSSIDSNTSDLYARHTNAMYFDTELLYRDAAIDVVDMGFSELKKLKDIVLSKINSNQIDMKKILEPPLLSLDRDRPLKQMLKQSNDVIESKDKQTDCQLIQTNNLIHDKQDNMKSVLQTMESELEMSDTISKYKCECDSPLPDSHRNQCELQVRIQRFLADNADLMEYSVSDLLDISHRNAIWPLFMDLMIKCGEYDKYLKYSLMLNDVKLLENIENYLFSAENFEQLLKHFARQRDPGNDRIVRCVQCDQPVPDINQSISWQTIMKFCIKTIGVEEAVSLLHKFIDRNPLFSIHFYLLLLRMRMICVNQSSVTRDKLHNLITHLNSVSKVKSSESHTSLSSINSEKHRQCHGFKISISKQKCGKCDTNLIRKSSKVGDKGNEKLVAFHCKHVFHKNCLNSRNHCILCNKESTVNH